MGYYGVGAVHDSGIVTALIEHTHIQAQDICHIDSAVHSALIGADDHGIVFVDLQCGNCAEQTLYKLVYRLYSLKAFQGDGILYPGIMGIKGDDVVNTHAHKLLERQCTVQGFTSGALVLTALI